MTTSKGSSSLTSVRNGTARLLCILSFIATNMSLATAAEFIPLGMEVPINVYYPEVVVAENGSVVVGQGAFGGMHSGQLLRWTPSSGTQLLLDNASIPSISGDGTTIVASRTTPSGHLEAIKITEVGIEVLTHLSNNAGSEARKISQDGSTIFGYTGNWTDPEWSRWTDDGVFPMPDLGYPAGISATGDTLLFQSLERWTEADGVTTLPEPQGSASASAFGLSSNGRWAVGRFIQAPGGPTNSQALRWDGLSAPELLLPSNEDWGSLALDVTTDGSLAVGVLALADEGPFVAGIWTQESRWVPLQDLLLTEYGLGDALDGWQLTRVYDVTNDGRYMVGHAFNPAGESEAFLVDLSPIPEPTTVALALFALVPLATRRIRRVGRRIRSTHLGH